jgi:hypothetical protein
MTDKYLASHLKQAAAASSRGASLLSPRHG